MGKVGQLLCWLGLHVWEFDKMQTRKVLTGEWIGDVRCYLDQYWFISRCLRCGRSRKVRGYG